MLPQVQLRVSPNKQALQRLSDWLTGSAISFACVEIIVCAVVAQSVLRSDSPHRGVNLFKLQGGD